ncbi:T9SS type A sorting domain-containing protein, partial [bacterium]|nr:T9SS type A sorting domain-containing protein [bacterium]MBU1881492.1 T9SS type A sorting domain-containing protein [bacterium]
PAGSHTFTFNAVHLPSGIYFVRVSAGGVQQVKKMVLIK